MIENPRPTRAEVSDVANAVYDGTDALMLSGESAVGKYPVKAVEIMKKEAGFCEPRVEYPKVKTIEEEEGQTAAVVEAANSLIGCKVNGKCEFSSVVVLTETGATARYLSRLRPKMPIIAVTSSSKAMRQMKLVWGIMPVRFIYRRESERGIRRIVKYLQGRRLLKRGQKIVIIHGKNWGKPGLTSVVRVQEVE